jgi:hypothetical protein
MPTHPPDLSRSPLNAVSGWKLDLLTTDFARFINSEVALLYEPGGKGQPPAAISSQVLGATAGRSRDHAKEGSSAARCRSGNSARPSNRLTHT